MFRSICLSIFLGIFMTASVWAGQINDLGLDDTTNYDIYLGNQSVGGAVLKGVKITETRAILGNVYLVVRSDAVFANSPFGLVRLDYVQAILPTFSSQPIQTNR